MKCPELHEALNECKGIAADPLVAAWGDCEFCNQEFIVIVVNESNPEFCPHCGLDGSGAAGSPTERRK